MSSNSLIQSQGVGDLYKIYAEAQRDGIDFNLAYIPKSFNAAPHREEFDTDYMRKLYQTGYELAVRRYQWEKNRRACKNRAHIYVTSPRQPQIR